MRLAQPLRLPALVLVLCAAYAAGNGAADFLWRHRSGVPCVRQDVAQVMHRVQQRFDHQNLLRLELSFAGRDETSVDAL